MNSCGMYDYAGEWAYEVGMPAKSGVSGGIIAVIPGQIGIGVFSPPIDAHGNSVRGIRVCQEISDEFGLHAFSNRTNVGSVIRRDYRGDVVRSNRLRTPEERKVLAKEGHQVVVIEVQGGTVLRLDRAAAAQAHASLPPDASYVIVDFKRVHCADTRRAKLIYARGAVDGRRRGRARIRRRSPTTARSGRSPASLSIMARRPRVARIFATPTRRSNGARTSCSPARRR